jgi:general secretion pathway protein B
MSFILDALKKSELERQRQSVPGLVETGPLRPRAGLPRWAIAVLGLLAVNLVILSVVLVRGWVATPAPAARVSAPHDPTAAAAAAAAAEHAAPVTPSSDHFSPLDGAPVYAPEIPVTANAPVAGGPDAGAVQPGVRSNPAVPPAAPQGASTDGAGNAAARGGHRRDPLLTDDSYKAADDEVLPTINETSLSGAQALPELHLDVHVFATRPADRFVYINMRKYREGATLEEGPTLERIRRDGVVLNYQGLRFLLPRQ